MTQENEATMGRPVTPPQTTRGKKLMEHFVRFVRPPAYGATELENLGLVEIAGVAGVSFDVIYKLLHLPHYRVHAKTAKRLCMRLKLTAELLEPAP